MRHSPRAFTHARIIFRPKRQRGRRIGFFSSAVLIGLCWGTHSARASESKKSPQKITEELKELQKKSGKTPSFRVSFEQQVFSALRKKTTRSTGELIFSQPLKFRWEIKSPNKEVYVNNGEWFWKYVERTKHAVRMPANAGELDFLDVIFKLDNLQNKFTIKNVTQMSDLDGKPVVPCPTNNTCILLEPLQESGQKNIELAINRTNGFVSAVRIGFRNGNRTLIGFSSFTEDKVSADTFEFTPPPGTAVDKR